MELRRVDASNLWEIVALKVAKGQESFVASNTTSILEAYAALASGGVAMPFGLYENGEPVGFAMIGFGCEDWPEAPAIAHDTYNLWRFMIDERHQGCGLGRKGLEAVLAFIRTFPCGKADRVWLSYEPENEKARRLYQSFGFVETGEMDGNERIAVKNL